MYSNHSQNRKITLYLACYFLLIAFGLLSFWSTLSQGIPEPHLFFSPVYTTLLIMLVLAFLAIQSSQRTIHLFVYLLSLFLISMILFPVLDLDWSSELISAYVYLLSIGTVLGLLFILMGRKIFSSLAISVSYSTLFLLIVLITDAIPATYHPMLLILGVGQVIAFILGYLYILIEHPPSQQKSLSAHKLSLPIPVLLIVFGLFFSGGYLLYHQTAQPGIILLLLLFVFSLFMLAALVQSLSKSFFIHCILSIGWIAFCVLFFSGYHVFDPQTLLGFILVFGIGIHLVLVKVLTGITRSILYGHLHILFLAGHIPHLIGSQEEWGVVLTFVFAYTIIHLFSYFIFLKAGDKGVSRRKDRRSRKEAFLHEEGKVKEKEEIQQLNMLSATESEKQLILHYRNWLEKKAEQMGVNFLEKR